MTNCARTALIYSALSVFILVSGEVANAQNKPLQDIAEELESDGGNPILQMQQQMLRHQNADAVAPPSNWRWMQRRTNLRREVSGNIGQAGRRNAFVQSAALLTGQRAIDESLQLGSIGVNRASDDQDSWVSIDAIDVVEIASHPWAEMVAGQAVTPPDISKLIPGDVLFVHMIRPNKFLELEGIAQQQSELFGDVYNLGGITGMKSRIIKRLGIPDADVLIAAVDEMAFISDDLSFLPRTDYAVVLRLANALAEKGLDLLVDEQAIHRKVGEYVVIATHESLIERIEDTYKNVGSSMFSTLDYHYALLEMEPQRDGLIYLSEAFIRKLTSPAYRINARRRNTILDALEALQYSVFAYRRLTDRWPASLQELVDTNYIASDSIHAQENYSVLDDGRVSHNTWGTLWQVTPVNQVPLDRISATEKDNYDRFSRGYQSFFREFFDPISIAYTITDQLYLHTLILPLIDNSDYRELQTFFGSTPGELSFLFDPDRLGAANIAAQFSIEDLLLRMGGRRGRSNDVEGESDAARRERLIYEAESEISEELLDEPLLPGERLLDFVGNEVFFGVGEQNSFTVSNIADIDVWFGLKLNDRERAEAFFRQLWKRIASQLGGRGAGGLLQLSSSEPLRNEYNGQEFFLLPTGFVNIFYIFLDDAFYVTISQVSMNRLIDAQQNGSSESLGPNLQRGFAHIGKSHNIVAALDLEKIATFELGQEVNFWGQRVSAQFQAHEDTLREAMTLAAILPEFDGTLANVEDYYHDLPTDFYGATFTADAGALYLTTDQQRTALGDIANDRRGTMLVSLLESSMPTEDLRNRVRAFRNATLGLSFVPEGLEVKLSVGNPMVSTPDARFSFSEPATKTRGIPMPILLAILALLGIATFMFSRRRSK